MKVNFSNLVPLLKETVTDWSDDKAPRLGAALAYYTVFSIAPLIIISITIAGLVFDNAQTQILDQVQAMLGPKGGAAIKSMIEATHKPATSIVATVLGLATLLLGAGGVFVQLKDAFNTIWKVKPKVGAGLWGFIRTYFVSFSMVLGIGFLLLVSLLLAAGLGLLGTYLSHILPALGAAMKILGEIVSFGIVTCLFAMLFKFLPDRKIAWRDVWTGAILTAGCFVVGKFLLGIYLVKANVDSAYGAAGSLVLILLWVYYSAQILFFGAEFTKVYAHCHGSCQDLPKAPKHPQTRKEKLVADSERQRERLDLAVGRLVPRRKIPGFQMPHGRN